MKLLLLVAQLCVWEADFTTGNDDCAAIVQVLDSRGLLNETGIHRYSPHFKRAKYREWIHHLDFSGNKPSGWPEKRSWRKCRELWYRTIAATARGLAGYRPCPAGTVHWGAPGFRADYWKRLGWSVQQCGSGTRNWFWKRTNRSRATTDLQEMLYLLLRDRR